MHKMKWSEGILPLIIVIYGVAYVAQTFSLPWNAILYPYALLALMAVLLLLVGLTQNVGQGGRDRGTTDRGPSPAADGTPRAFWKGIAGRFFNSRRGSSVVLCTFIYPIVIQYFGFMLTTFLFLIALFIVFKTFRPIYIFLISILTTGGLSMSLRYFLHLNLPAFKFAELPFGF